jgi:hypothetical protein
LANLVLRDYDAGSHGGLFDDRGLALAVSWPSAADGTRRCRAVTELCQIFITKNHPK